MAESQTKEGENEVQTLLPFSLQDAGTSSVSNSPLVKRKSCLNKNYESEAIDEARNKMNQIKQHRNKSGPGIFFFSF